MSFSQYDRLRLRGEIGIFYDPYDATTSQIAKDLFFALDLANVSSNLYEVLSVSKFDSLLRESGVKIAIYLFQSNLTGITLRCELLKWKEFAEVLSKHKSVQHIVGIGNTRTLAKFVEENSTNVHLADTEVVDAKLTFLFSLWTIAEVLKETREGEYYRDVELDIRCVGLKFFADEFNDLFERTLEPKVPLGQEDLQEKQKRYEEMLKRFSYGVRELSPIPPEEMTPDEIVKVELNKQNSSVIQNELDYQTVSVNISSTSSEVQEDENSVPKPRLYLTHMGDSYEKISVTGNPTTEILYKIIDLPLKSGLDGPIGKVVDLLLETLLSEGKDAAAMAKSTVEEILKVVKIINLVVGIGEGAGGSSELKELFDLIKNEWPVLEEYDVFFDLFVDALYAFRSSDVSSIREMVRSILTAIMELTGEANPDAIAIMDTLVNIFFNSTSELVQRLSSSERNFETLLVWFFEKLMNETEREFPGASEIYDAMVEMMRIREEADNTLQGVMETILEGLAFALVSYYNLDQDVYKTILEAIFPSYMGVSQPKSVEDAVNRVLQILPSFLNESQRSVVETILTASIHVEGVFKDGYHWIFNRVLGWLSGEAEALFEDLTGGILQKIETYSFFHLEGDFPLGLGDWSAFQVSYDLALDAGVDIKTEKLFEFVGDIIFDGFNWEMGDTGDVLKRVLSFVEIVPTFKASIEVGGFGSEKNAFMQMLLESLGFEISFEGGAHCNIELFRASTSNSTFMRVVEWGFNFKVELSRDFTLLDFLTGGVGGGALNSLAEYIGLDSVVITVHFGLSVDIVKRASSPSGPEQGTFTLIIQIGTALQIGIDIIIASITFYGSLDVIFTFVQDLIGDAPLTIMMDLVAYVKVTIGFLFFDKSFDWGPKTIYHDQWPHSSGTKEEAENSGYALGVDRDDDGLSDEYEERMNLLGIVLLDSRNNDTDGDGLTDKEEMQTVKTDPTNPDTDGEGLSDYEECYIYRTNPRQPDTDYDGLTDYEEVKIYKTDPNVMDTDKDGLDDYFEVHHVWDISNCTTSVKEVWIGGVAYNDHTDPLNPDTDNDGLLDGEEGPSGAYYGLDTPGLYNWTLADQGNITGRPIIFNYGYTHPLDNDTDDDSYLQWWNGSIALVSGKKQFLRSMTDGEEVKGIWVVMYDPLTDDWERKLIKTNPCNPDTDGDTGPSYPQFSPPPETNKYIMSDGYELSLDPPQDPTEGDSDHDGILDGLEGVLNPDSYHTNPINPDTDGDGLGDLQEVLLGTNARNPDTDHDSVLDGEEYYKFHTDPLLSDSDFDALTDGEELYFWHTNPLSRDSDGDKISDGLEVLRYDTDPMDEDTDNDGISDFDEIFKHMTNPFNPDTDGDGLRDGEEAFIYLSDPLNWDTDKDSIEYPNEYGQMTWPMSDGDEVLRFNTDPVHTDSDKDGLNDGLELYLASGRIPQNVLNPIPLDAVNPDTDGDGLLDGEELRVGNTSSIIYPYLAVMPYSFYNTSAVNPDTDGDGLSDFEEINGTLSNSHSFEQGIAKFNYTGSIPYLWDTDGDGLGDGDEVLLHGTDPCKADTDGDGIIDSYETTLYDTSTLTSEVFYSRQKAAPGAPNASFSFSPIRQTVSYQPFTRPPQVTFNASTSRDIDGTIVKYYWDFGDGTNITKLSSEANPTIVRHSYLAYGNYTVSLTVTDNDGLNSTVKANVIIRLSTSALDSDSDNDKAPDGYEVSEIRITTYNASYTEVYTITPVETNLMVLHYPVTAKYGVTEIKPTTDPLDPDSDDDGVLDGDEFDLDHDRIRDGDEFYTDKTWQGMFYKPNGSLVIGGLLSSDSDGDGLSDGIEKYEIGTSPINPDTDGDGYSDGAEVAVGTDPLQPTSPEEYRQALERLRSGKIISVISPSNTTTIDVTVSVLVLNSTYIQNMWFRYNDGTGWSQNYTLEYEPQEELWKNTTMLWNYSSYHLEVFGKLADGYVVIDEVWFTVKEPSLPPSKIIRIISPTNTTLTDVNVNVLVLNSTIVKAMWFRYNDGSGWSQNYTLEYDPQQQQWKNTTLVLDYKSYHLQVFGELADGQIVWDEVWFTIKSPTPTEAPPTYLWLILGFIIGTSTGSVSVFFFFRKRAKKNSKFKDESAHGAKKEDKK
jgi:PKD repeat protein